MAQKTNTDKGNRASIIQIDLLTSKRKKELANVAYWKGAGSLNAYLRTLLIKHLEEVDEKYKRDRPKNLREE